MSDEAWRSRFDAPITVEPAPEVIEWSPPPMYENHPEVVVLLRRVRNWQYSRGMTPDGLIGPSTWRQRDERLKWIAACLLTELEKDVSVQAQLYRFLKQKLGDSP